MNNHKDIKSFYKRLCVFTMRYLPINEEKQGNVSEYKKDVSQLIVEHRKSGENAPFLTTNSIHFVHGHK